MYTYNDDDDCFLFYSYDDEQEIFMANTEDTNDDSLIKVYQPSKNEGTYCRACGEFNIYAEPDNIIPDKKFTCWICSVHPYRRLKGIPREKIVDFENFHKK